MASIHGVDANRQYWSNAPSKMRLTICHQFPGTELVSPVYAGIGVICYLSPSQRVNVDSTAQAGFDIHFSRGKPMGILMYELKRKNTKQFNKNVTSSGDETRCIQLVMVWEVNDSRELCVVSYLIEHDKGCIWDKDNLMKLAKWYKLYDVQYVPIEVTYLMRDNRVLMTRANVTREVECYKLDMTISETSIKYNTWRLWYIDVGRLVSIMTLVTTFTY
jgi:hypothetical protein